MADQFKKGILEMCILYCISEKDMYGYDIMQKIHQYFPELDESTIYSILRRLHKNGIIDSYIGEFSNGPKRKYYTISENGKIELKENIMKWKHIVEIMSDIGIL